MSGKDIDDFEQFLDHEHLFTNYNPLFRSNDGLRDLHDSIVFYHVCAVGRIEIAQTYNPIHDRDFGMLSAGKFIADIDMPLPAKDVGLPIHQVEVKPFINSHVHYPVMRSDINV